jgi:hypothetical protein
MNGNDYSNSIKGKLPTLDIDKSISPNGKLKHTTMIFSSISRSGKSTLINFLLKKIKHRYDIIILISQNSHNDIYGEDDIYDVKINKDHKKLIKQIRYFQKKTKNKLNFMIVFDDYTSNRIKYDTTLTNLFVNGRNANISVIFSAQEFTMIAKVVRLNSRFVFVLKQNNPQSNMRATQQFIYGFVEPPPYIKLKMYKMEWCRKFLLAHTQDYNAICLDMDNIKSGVYNIKATV